MDTEYNVAITLAYQDAEKRTYTFSGVDPSELGEVKDRIIAINTNMPANFSQTFVSNGGASCVMIASAKIIVIEEEVIYNAG